VKGIDLQWQLVGDRPGTPFGAQEHRRGVRRCVCAGSSVAPHLATQRPCRRGPRRGYYGSAHAHHLRLPLRARRLAREQQVHAHGSAAVTAAIVEMEQSVCSPLELEARFNPASLYATAVCSDGGCPVAAMEENRAGGGACRAHLGAHHLFVKMSQRG
jgi:hypothetical protein